MGLNGKCLFYMARHVLGREAIALYPLTAAQLRNYSSHTACPRTNHGGYSAVAGVCARRCGFFALSRKLA
jgi:hypothetical protein